jgi:serine phosphatase RsbU (regulator of sigma subunit)
MRSTFFTIITLILVLTPTRAQDFVVLYDNTVNRSIANEFHIYQVDENRTDEIDLNNFTSLFEISTKRRLQQSVDNIDFTTQTYWFVFEAFNAYNVGKEFIIEIARPITNTVELYEVRNNKAKLVGKSGDGIDYSEKTIVSNRSLLPIYLYGKEKKTYAIKLVSDGETISLPFVFWEQDVLSKQHQTRSFLIGLFYGIFLFVIVIYSTFYFLLKDNSFLLYTVYVLFSGLLQFGLDGYIHEYIFTSGNYFTQHSILFVASGTVLFVLLYTKNYLKISQNFNKINVVINVLIVLVVIAGILSLIPGPTYVMAYPIINGLSFISILMIVLVALYARRKGLTVSLLFIIGISTLILGAIFFILGNFGVINAPKLTQNSLKLGTLIEILCLSILMAFKYRSLQQEKEQAQAELLVELKGKNELMQNMNAQLEIQVKERTKEIEQAKIEIENKNQDIISSIKYAERIQRSILPSDEKFKSLLPASFILYQPRDIVSGDFYWIEQLRTNTNRNLIVYATADCTGHGVPGAFVSILGYTFLKLSKSEESVNTPGEALDFINRGFNETFIQQYDGTRIKDGMDVALCAIDYEEKKLFFSGAKNPVYIVRGNEIIVLKGDSTPIGFPVEEMENTFVTHTIDLMPNDTIYTFSDGFADQFGGPKGKKFMYKQFKEVLIRVSNLPIDDQREELLSIFNNWIKYVDENGSKFEYDQIDDVLIIGVKIE